MKRYPPQVKAKCHALYLNGVSDAENSEQTGASISAIKSWIHSSWKKERDELEQSLIRNATHEFMEHIGRERIKTAKDHIEVSRLIVESIKHRLKPDKDGSKKFLTDQQLGRLARALKDAADVGARAAGLNDKTPDLPGSNNAKGLIVVGLHATPVQESNTPDAIDITSEVTASKVCPF